MGQLEDPIDRSSVSLVCKKWYDVDAFRRKHVTVAFCYSIHASDLTHRKPRAAMYNLLPDDWGGLCPALDRPNLLHLSLSLSPGAPSAQNDCYR